MALDDNGIIYSFGANGCGQLGQDIPARVEELGKSFQARQEKLRVTEGTKLWEAKRSVVNSTEDTQQHLTINLQILRSGRRAANTSNELCPTNKEELSITHFYPNPNMVKSYFQRMF